MALEHRAISWGDLFLEDLFLEDEELLARL